MKTILVVEDEPIIGLEIVDTLRRLGYRSPDAVTMGEDVPEAVVKHRPDLILMDIRLRGFQDGIETAYLIGGEFGLPTVFLSAYSDEEMIRRAQAVGAYGFLVKPFDERSLKTTIEIALAKSKDDGLRLVAAAQDRFGTLLDELAWPVFVSDLVGRLVHANKEGLACLNKESRDSLDGLSVQRDLGAIIPWKLGEKPKPGEILGRATIKGEDFTARWSPLFSEAGGLRGALIVLEK
jgi:AmiR/NasT family two-component response regulator